MSKSRKATTDDDIGGLIVDIASGFVAKVDTQVDEIAQEVAKNTVSTLKQTSPKRKGGGKYARGWTCTQIGTGRYNVHNRTDYQLTHLLEYGHAVVRHGTEVGRAPAIPHIEPAREQARAEFASKLKAMKIK